MAEHALQTSYRRSAEPASGAHVWRPPLYFSLLASGLLLVSAYEVLVRQAVAFGRGAGYASNTLVLVGVAAFVLGVATMHHWRHRALASLAPLLVLTALFTAVSASAQFVAFANNQTWLCPALLTANASLLGASATALAHGLGPWWRQLALLAHLLGPFTLLGALGLLSLAISLGPLIGLLRSAYVSGALLALAALWFCRLHHYLSGTWVPHARLVQQAASVVVAGSALGMVWSESWVNRQQLAWFQNPIVFADHSGESEIVVTSSATGLELFQNRSLRSADIDGYRYHEALVHPAFAFHKNARRVLILGSADGFVEREVLRHRSVVTVDVVTHDKALSRLASRAAWLEQRTGGAIRSPKLEVTEAEAMVWLEHHQGLYDIIIVDLPDPTEPRWGKHFTRYFYGLLARHLDSAGVVALQAGNILTAPRGFRSIQASVEAAPLHSLGYHASLPSIGDWGFLLAAHRTLELGSARRLELQGTRFVSNEVLNSLFALPKDTRGPKTPPSTLYHQRVVELLPRRAP